MHLDYDPLNINQKTILALMELAGGEVKRYSSLQLSMYSLNDTGLHSYDFNERCSWGPSDPQFREDLNNMCGYINYESYVDKDDIPHALYRLPRLGHFFADKALEEIKIDKNAYSKLQQTAKLLNQSKTMKSEFLYEKYVDVIDVKI